MTILMINDLPNAADLDRQAMSAVRGGQGVPSWMSSYGLTQPAFTNFSFDASQMLGQTQNVMNNNGNNVAFASGISSTVNPTQTGSNNINLF
jgi:hypothetical protein